MSTPAIQSSNSTPPDTSGNSTKKINTDPTLADKSTFLKLLVVQLKNQDPQNPADGTEFVTQLAQFSTLEQQIAMRSNLDQIVDLLKNPPAQEKTAAS
ncbi:MAG: flagellar hook capping FlgD N-terminal domain-containing protein [Bryobacteraceae bacterium]